MAEFDSSITAYIGGDYSGLTEAVTGAEGQIKQLDAKFETLGANMTKVPQAFAEENKKAMGQILSGEERLAAYREKTAFSRMTDEEKLAVLRAQGMGILNRINDIEGETVEKTGLKLQLEKKKTEIYDLNNKVTADGLITQKASTEETGEHTKKATGLAGVVESIKKGFKDMGVNLQGAGIGIAFAGFISLGKEAIANAQKQRDAYEAMSKPLEAATASLARFGDAIDGIKKGTAEAAGAFVSFVTRAGEGWGMVYNRLQGISAEQEKAAESSERAANLAEKRRDAARIEFMDVEKNYASHKAFEASQKAFNDAKLSAEGKHNVLIAEALALSEKITVEKGRNVDPIRFQNELLEKQKQIMASNISMIDLELNNRIGAINAAATLNLTFADREKSVKNEIIVLADAHRKILEQTGLTSENTHKAQMALTQKQNELTKIQRDQQSSLNLEGAQYQRLLELQLKSKEYITAEERAELAVLELKTKERQLSKQIEEATAAVRVKAAGDVTKEELKVIDELQKQKLKIEEQIKAKEALVKKVVTTQIPAEKDVTRQTIIQSENLASQVEDIERIGSGKRDADGVFRFAPDVVNGVTGYKQIFGGGGQNLQNMSSTMLQGILEKQNDILNSLDSSGRLVRDATYTEGGDIMAKVMAENLMANAKKELDLRKEIQVFALRMGDVATIMKYGDAQTERAFRSFTVGADKTNTLLERLSDQLASTGLFEKA